MEEVRTSFQDRICSKIRRSLMFGGFCFIVFSLFLASIPKGYAAVLPYQAQVSAGSVTMQPGEVKTITLKFKNIGSKTWIRGQSATAVYLYGDSSIFGHSSWLKDDMPALIKESSVKPGYMATASFSVRAPLKAGVYQERFLLSYGPSAWIKGSVITVTFTVASAVVASQPSPSVLTDKLTPSTEWKAQLVDKGGIEWQLIPGEQALVSLAFKNVGTRTWKNTGTNYISLYTWSPKYRKSPFKDASWENDSQAATLVEAEVKPGQIGHIQLQLLAPAASGLYQETFQLAAENAAWMEGGTVTLPIRVVATGAPTNPGTSISTGSNNSYSGVLLLTSHKQITSAGSEKLTLTQGFKNAGPIAWTSRALKLLSVTPQLGTYSSIFDQSWLSPTEPVKALSPTAPGEIGFISYTIKAPAKKGNYVAAFQLVADGQEVQGGTVEIPITVTDDGYIDPTPIPIPGQVVTPGGEPLPLTGDTATLPVEPILRVGLYKTTDDTMKLRGVLGGFSATLNGLNVCQFKQGEIATVIFDRSAKLYRLSGPNCQNQSPGWYVFVADDGISPLEITDYSRPIAWLPGSNDNKFRAKLELRYTPATNNVWVINELPLETYLKGIAETSDVSPLEFQKTLLVAARTYALYHYNRNTKHVKEFFHVDATYDQVYRGYGQEARSPNIVDGVVKTRGQIVTHEGKLAVTPYFSRSDGRTRDWTEVWAGGAIPWLKSVPVLHDVGQTLWGHGVGMSARGALYMASRDKMTYDQILKHFYIGTELRKAYK